MAHNSLRCGSRWPKNAVANASRAGVQGSKMRQLSRFTPTFDKWAGQSCGGVSIHVTDRTVFRSYEMTARILKQCRGIYPGQFLLNPPPYEYEASLMPIDIISGSSLLRESLTEEREIDAAISLDCEAWNLERREFLLYR